MATTTTDLPERMRSKINVTPGGCWMWTGAKGSDGYGLVRHEGVVTRAHRLAYLLLVGPIPVGLEPDHLCRTPLCVNPEHLEPVTHQENMRRAYDTPACRNGHPWTPETTRIRPGDGHRYCLVCNRDKARRHREREAQR